MNQFIELARPGRAFANLCQRQPLPGGTDSINIPKILTGTSTAIQVADNTQVEEVDATDTFINAPVRTIAGQQGVALQLIDQSPISYDQVIFNDLIADHASKLDLQTLEGTGVNGQVLGLANTPGIQRIVCTAPLTIQGVYSVIADAIQRIHVTRYMPPTVIVMHPRRWSWLLTLLDEVSRPLFLPGNYGASNAVGVVSDVDSQAVVGQIHGLPVVTDPLISTVAGAGGDEDVIYVLRASDIILWESSIKARTLMEPRAETLTCLLQVFSYVAYSCSRYAQSIVEISGFPPPTF